MEEVFTPGKMEDNMMETGTMANSMEKEFTDKQMDRREEDYGKKEKE